MILSHRLHLLRRALFTTPYYYVGCLHLAEPQSPREFLADVTHGLGGAAAGRQAELNAVRARYAATPGAPVSAADAQDMLRALLPAYPDVQLAADHPRLDRGAAALLRWNALQEGPLARRRDVTEGEDG